VSISLRRRNEHWLVDIQQLEAQAADRAKARADHTRWHAEGDALAAKLVEAKAKFYEASRNAHRAQ